MNEMPNMQPEHDYLPWQETLCHHPTETTAGAADSLAFFRKDHKEVGRDYEYISSINLPDPRLPESTDHNRINTGNLINVKLNEVTDGSDFIPNLLALSVANENKIFLISASSRPAKGYPKKIPITPGTVGGRSFSSSRRDSWKNAGLIEEINWSQAQIVVFGINTPFQKDWIVRHRNKLKFARIIVINGAIIDFSAGRFLSGSPAARLGRLFRAS